MFDIVLDYIPLSPLFLRCFLKFHSTAVNPYINEIIKLFFLSYVLVILYQFFFLLSKLFKI